MYKTVGELIKFYDINQLPFLLDSMTILDMKTSVISFANKQDLSLKYVLGGLYTVILGSCGFYHKLIVLFFGS